MIPFDSEYSSRLWYLEHAQGPASFVIYDFYSQSRKDLLKVSQYPMRTVVVLENISK